MTTTVPPLVSEVGVFAPDQVEELTAFYRVYGFAVVRGSWTAEELDAVDAAGARAQQGLLDGTLPERHGTLHLVDDEDGARTSQFANYVTYATEVDLVLAEAARRAQPFVEALIGPAWLLEHDTFGVVWQDARPGRESSYTRIGWHSDWQSGPHLNRWPSTAFTLHLDATSPANGFLRVVPGSQLWATPAPVNMTLPEGSARVGGYTSTPPPFPMPLGFEKVPGEIAVYCERGDVLLHDAYLWHSAARATADGAIRRHLRGGWYAGDPSEADVEDFVKNAAR